MPTTMRNNYWARIRKTRLSNHDIDKPWLIKIYPPGARGYFDYIGTSRAKTFKDAIRIAYQNIEYEKRKDIANKLLRFAQSIRSI